MRSWSSKARAFRSNTSLTRSNPKPRRAAAGRDRFGPRLGHCHARNRCGFRSAVLSGRPRDMAGPAASAAAAIATTRGRPRGSSRRRGSGCWGEREGQENRVGEPERGRSRSNAPRIQRSQHAEVLIMLTASEDQEARDIGLKLRRALAAAVEAVTGRAGLDPHVVKAVVTNEALYLAARAHESGRESFLRMARTALRAVRSAAS